MQLDGVIEQLRRLHCIECNLAAPRVAYRETIARATECRYAHMLRPVSSGLFVTVGLAVEPSERDAGNEFISEVDGTIIPASCIAAVGRGVNSTLANGFALGFPIVDVQVRLIEIEYCSSDDIETALTIAARTALAEACSKAGRFCWSQS